MGPVRPRPARGNPCHGPAWPELPGRRHCLQKLSWNGRSGIGIACVSAESGGGGDVGLSVGMGRPDGGVAVGVGPRVGTFVGASFTVGVESGIGIGVVVRVGSAASVGALSSSSGDNHWHPVSSITSKPIPRSLPMFILPPGKESFGCLAFAPPLIASISGPLPATGRIPTAPDHAGRVNPLRLRIQNVTELQSPPYCEATILPSTSSQATGAGVAPPALQLGKPHPFIPLPTPVATSGLRPVRVPSALLSRL